VLNDAQFNTPVTLVPFQSTFTQSLNPLSSQYNFAINSAAGFNYVGTSNLACICKGSKIKTPNGDILIENIKIGDFVITHDNRKVKVIDRMFYNHIVEETTHPCIIRKGNYDATEDLCLSGNHAVLVDDVFILSKKLDVEKHTFSSIIEYHLIRTEDYFSDTLIGEVSIQLLIVLIQKLWKNWKYTVRMMKSLVI
jgi:hypothetical protein